MHHVELPHVADHQLEHVVVQVVIEENILKVAVLLSYHPLLSTNGGCPSILPSTLAWPPRTGFHREEASHLLEILLASLQHLGLAQGRPHISM